MHRRKSRFLDVFAEPNLTAKLCAAEKLNRAAKFKFELSLNIWNPAVPGDHYLRRTGRHIVQGLAALSRSQTMLAVGKTFVLSEKPHSLNRRIRKRVKRGFIDPQNKKEVHTHKKKLKSMRQGFSKKKAQFLRSLFQRQLSALLPLLGEFSAHTLHNQTPLPHHVSRSPRMRIDTV